MTLTSPENMMKVRAVSPLDLAGALNAWTEATDAVRRGEAVHPLIERTGPVGRTYPEMRESNQRNYSNRFCAGLFEWLKEV